MPEQPCSWIKIPLKGEFWKFKNAYNYKIDRLSKVVSRMTGIIHSHRLVQIIQADEHFWKVSRLYQILNRIILLVPSRYILWRNTLKFTIAFLKQQGLKYVKIQIYKNEELNPYYNQLSGEWDSSLANAHSICLIDTCACTYAILILFTTSALGCSLLLL